MDKRLCELIYIQEFIENTMIRGMLEVAHTNRQEPIVIIFSQIRIK